MAIDNKKMSEFAVYESLKQTDFIPVLSDEGGGKFDNKRIQALKVKGDKGEKGDKGDTGDTGPKGADGNTGPQGDRGLSGVQGAAGDKGEKGDKGDKGDKGETGEAGSVSSIPDGTESSPGIKFASGGGFYKASDVVRTSGHFATPLTVKNATAKYILTSADAGKTVVLKNGGIGVDLVANQLDPGESVVFINDTNLKQVISPGTGVTARLAAEASPGNIEMDGYGVATILCISSNKFVVLGGGLS